MPKHAPKSEVQKPSPSKVINIEKTDVSNFDESLTFLKEKFNAEMKRVDEEMNVFTHTLKNIYAAATTENTSKTSTENSPANWESLTNSPLVHGEGEDKLLKLQFDLSAFDPAEVKVELNGDLLIVSARHDEESAASTVHRDFKREFLLPRNTDPESVVSSISRDGVLTVQVRLPTIMMVAKAEETVLTKQVSKKNRVKPTADPRIAPGAPPGNLIPQSPMSSASPASPEKISTQILKSQETSKQSSNIKTQPQPQRK